jgi:hypothetical protein
MPGVYSVGPLYWVFINWLLGNCQVEEKWLKNMRLETPEVVIICACFLARWLLCIIFIVMKLWYTPTRLHCAITLKTAN